MGFSEYAYLYWAPVCVAVFFTHKSLPAAEQEGKNKWIGLTFLSPVLGLLVSIFRCSYIGAYSVFDGRVVCLFPQRMTFRRLKHDNPASQLVCLI